MVIIGICRYLVTSTGIYRYLPASKTILDQPPLPSERPIENMGWIQWTHIPIFEKRNRIRYRKVSLKLILK